MTCTDGTTPDPDKNSCIDCNSTCSCSNSKCRSPDILKTTIRLQNGDEMRSKLSDDLLPLAFQQCSQGNIKQCQILINLCVLQHYERETNNACGLFDEARRSFNPWQITLDPLYFNGDSDSELGKEVAITQQYIFDNSDRSVIHLIFAIYNMEGDFDGFFDAKSFPLHFCQNDVQPGAPYRFGRRSGANSVNRLAKEQNRWILTRRFFLLDDFSITTKNGSVVRVASHVKFHIWFQKNGDGLIHPPYIEIDYNDNFERTTVESSFQVVYGRDPGPFDRDLEITMFVICPISVIWAALSAYSWGRRNGKVSAVDASSVLKLVLYECALLGDVFFIVVAVVACWTTFSYKSQTYVFYKLLSERQEQASERPTSRDISREVKQEAPVIWRTYLIANEWNELQRYRKTRLPLQIVTFLFLHEYFSLKNWAIVEPGFHRNLDDNFYDSTLLTRFAVVVFLYLSLAFIQWIIQVLLIERVILDPFHNFIDLCSVSNISVLSLTESLHGFYIHGRSVHGKGDAGMAEMNDFLQRERDSLCGFRGLEPSSELQTYIVNLPQAFRQKYDEIRQMANAQLGPSVTGHDAVTAKMHATVKAHGEMNEFLKAFIEHANSDLGYVIRDRTVAEAVLDLEFNDTSVTGNFMRDPSEMMFSRCFVYGNEWKWLSFECLLTCVIFLISDSIHLAFFVVFLTSSILKLIFSILSTNHLSRVGLVDNRFLL
ncbi:unnamed protein product [Caenorhabditis auriculariae]|uniref:Meckelin n=1 Tax=Caenorhabditis auriculariae TaxID=2777116 RepID=A0A8S1HT91_9PELO|nr:unnamed protein product [Caenorhabditis auriculariae]